MGGNRKGMVMGTEFASEAELSDDRRQYALLSFEQPPTPLATPLLKRY